MCLANNLTVLQFPLNSAADLYTKKNLHVIHESLLQLLASIFRTLSQRCDNKIKGTASKARLRRRTFVTWAESN